LITGFPAHAETLDLKNPKWTEVPGTQRPPGTPEEFGASYVEMNRMVKHGSTRVIDMLDGDQSYARVEIDCGAKRRRELQVGQLESRTRVRFVKLNYPWRDSRDDPVATFVFGQ
jgi:hypothetical protein